MGVPVFVYGTLLDPLVFARFAGRTPLRRALPARLAGWQRATLRGTPYPTLRRGSGEVAGLLLPRLAPAAMQRLAAYEGASYRLAPVRVVTLRGPRRARAWIAATWRSCDGTETPSHARRHGNAQPRENVSDTILPGALDLCASREAARFGSNDMADGARRVLVVEDEALVAMLVEDALLDAGFLVIGPAATVEEALAMLDREAPDVVVLDLNLAGETSTPIADELAARGIPYVIATGYGASGLPPGHQNAMVLAKPYDPAELTSMLGRICREAA